MAKMSILESVVRNKKDEINEKIATLVSDSSSQSQLASIKEVAEGLSTVWTTIGGIEKISSLNRGLEEMDTNKLTEITNSLLGSKVDYSLYRVIDSQEPILKKGNGN